MTVQIRRGRPEDAGFLAWVMLAASRAHLARGIWELIVGADEAGCLDYLGLVQALLQRTLSEAVSARRKSAQIITYIGNAPAICAYQKSGFSISEEKRCEEFESLLGSPGFVRLIREL